MTPNSQVVYLNRLSRVKVGLLTGYRFLIYWTNFVSIDLILDPDNWVWGPYTDEMISPTVFREITVGRNTEIFPSKISRRWRVSLVNNRFPNRLQNSLKI